MNHSSTTRTLVLPFVGTMILLFAVSCGWGGNTSHKDGNENADRSFSSRCTNAVYYWKTTFALNESELEFLNKHKVGKMYLRLFDVDVDSSPMNGYVGAVPVGTTRFKSAIPDGVEIIPTVFITTKAIMSLGGNNDTPHSLAEKIFLRVKNMSSYNELGHIREIQLDCDWTRSTQKAFYDVCREMKSLAEKDSVLVSATVRLHQLKQDPPPVDRGVLMIYNTGALRMPGTKNSILEVSDVESYLKGNVNSYNLPLDFAYPIFGWGVLFRNGSYLGILHHTDFSDSKYYADNGDGTFRVIKEHFLEGHSLLAGDIIRLEYPSAEVVKKVSEQVSSKFKGGFHSTILYHLDSQNLAKFSTDEIANIYSY